jgi:NAD-dependent DNA ligase
LEAAGPKLREKLIRAGIETVQDLLRAPMEEILAIQGIGEKTAERLIEEAKELQERRGRELAEEAARAAAAASQQASLEGAAGEESSPVAEGAPTEEGALNAPDDAAPTEPKPEEAVEPGESGGDTREETRSDAS